MLVIPSELDLKVIGILARNPSLNDGTDARHRGDTEPRLVSSMVSWEWRWGELHRVVYPDVRLSDCVYER